MSVSNGPNLGKIISAADGDAFGTDFRKLLRALDVLLQSAVISITLTAPPGSPTNGDRYIVGASPTGAWSGQAKSIAVWTTDNPASPSGVWEFYAPKAGFRVYNVADATIYIYSGSAWGAFSGGGGGGSSLLQATTVNFTSAQLLALQSTPVQVLPAPGAGNFYVILGAAISLHFGTSAYVLGDNANILLVATFPFTGLTLLAVLGQTSDFAATQAASAAGAPSANVDNAPVFAQFDGSADITGGDGTADFTLYYAVLSL